MDEKGSSSMRFRPPLDRFGLQWSEAAKLPTTSKPDSGVELRCSVAAAGAT
jgi:hypothetical protein